MRSGDGVIGGMGNESLTQRYFLLSASKSHELKKESTPDYPSIIKDIEAK